MPQPLTAAQEIDRDTERPNSVQEGLEPAGENAVAAPLITADFVQMQQEMARDRLRMGLPSMPGGKQGDILLCSAINCCVGAVLRPLHVAHMRHVAHRKA
jgi:hypothetical protein